MTGSIRPAAVAGAFYPADPRVLARTIDELVATSTGGRGDAHAFIVPHAGLEYSGPVAASVYGRLATAATARTRVVLLGPSHRVAFSGLAVPGAAAFETPLGRVPIDEDACAALLELPFVKVLPSAHAKEHSLEVQVPFLQRVLGAFSLVPLVVGDASTEQVAQVLERLWGGPETVVLVSSDLSHFHPYGDAQRLDAETAKRIMTLDAGLEGDEACGCRPVNGLLEVARRRGLRCTQLDLRNSGDTAADRSRVVGYGAFAFEVAS